MSEHWWRFRYAFWMWWIVGWLPWSDAWNMAVDIDLDDWDDVTPHDAVLEELSYWTD